MVDRFGMDDSVDTLGAGDGEQLLEHARFPYHRGWLANASCHHREWNVGCGDEVEIYLSIHKAIVQAAWFTGKGCLVSQAAASMLCCAIDGQPLAEVRALQLSDMLGLIGVPLSPLRQNCGLLAFRALSKLLANYEPSSSVM